jgi:tRNA pseudouridine55 synthase
MKDLRGILNVYKPSGPTSRDVVDGIARSLRKSKLKVGHAGTLDPLASGVLVLCLGSATRLIEYVQRQTKVYRTTILLGARSDTLDAMGAVVASEVPAIPTEAEVRQALREQVGSISQLPPQFSALKVEGRRAYELARAGETVDLAPRIVRIDSIDLIRYEWPRLEIEVTCGAGTYIRSIARDLGERLGCGGLVEVLTRTRIGRFEIESALVVPDGKVDPNWIRERLEPPEAALEGMARVWLTAEAQKLISDGRPIPHAEGRLPDSEEIALFDSLGRLRALGVHERIQGMIRPVRVFPIGD